ncbi:MAG: hypothetical protein GF346_00540 [Candidatus Eisenbacteria bacterium]|nr:hypothetical protein [Candidatus Latescibacterota bacterium]MBD3300918.1 hypothetical protein [Candidatus Eisenbacteria bacterium]
MRALRIAGLLVAALLLLDLIVYLVLPPLKNPIIGLRGLFVADTTTGYRLAPSWSGLYDDGVVQGRIRTNRLGDRDEEPDREDPPDLLLLGDSFAFGSLLDQDETIDRWIETLSEGRVAAYNRGVPGYGPPAIREHLRRCPIAPERAALYLFYNNDLRDDNLLPDMGLTAVDGFMASRIDRGGRTLDEAEIRRRIEERIAPSTGRFLESWTRLRNLRRLTGLLGMKERIRTLFEPERKLMSHWGGYGFSDRNVEAAVDATRDMAGIARDRGFRFRVVLVPTYGEVRAGRYAALTESYASGLRDAGIPTVRLLGRLEPGDYYSHNLHFRPSGARKTARTILETIRRPSRNLNGVDAFPGWNFPPQSLVNCQVAPTGAPRRATAPPDFGMDPASVIVDN